MEHYISREKELEMNPLASIKHKLSHVKASSWLYRFAKSIWGKKTGGKSCTFYWFKLPLAFLVWCLILILFPLYTIVMGFFGFVPVEYPGRGEMSSYHDWYKRSKFAYPYKTLPNGTKVRIAPWEIALLGGLLYALYYLVFVDRYLGMWVGFAALAVAILAILVFVLTKSWQSEPLQAARSGLSEAWGGVTHAWDKICPPLVVEDGQTLKEPQIKN